LRFHKEHFSLVVGEAKGREPPAWFVNQPAVDPVGRFYIDSFTELSTDRAGPGQLIPRWSLADFAEKAGLDCDAARIFGSVIRRLDLAYLDWVKAQQPPPPS